MAIKPDHRYNGVVGPGSQVLAFESGSVGYQVNLSCEDGDTSFIICLTAKNKARAARTFRDVLDVDPEKLTNPTFVEFELAQAIEGKEVSFEARNEEYKGKVTVKVAFIGKKRVIQPSRAMAEFFGAQPEKDEMPPF